MQKFNKGDHVHVAKDLGQYMSHFPSDCEAIVIGSHRDQYGGCNTDSYTIHINGKGETSWYYDHQLELIETGRIDLLEQWERNIQDEIETKSNLDWIFKNGKEVIKNPHKASIQALANCFGLIDLWGSGGDGFTYYSNAIGTISFAAPHLEKGDKEGWLNYCKTDDDPLSECSIAFVIETNFIDELAKAIRDGKAEFTVF